MSFQLQTITDVATGLCWDAAALVAGAQIRLNACMPSTAPTQIFNISLTAQNLSVLSVLSAAPDDNTRLCVSMVPLITDASTYTLTLKPCMGYTTQTFNLTDPTTPRSMNPPSCVSPNTTLDRLLTTTSRAACTSIALKTLQARPRFTLIPNPTNLKINGLCVDGGYGSQRLRLVNCDARRAGQLWHHLLGQIRNIESGLCVDAPGADGSLDPGDVVGVYLSLVGCAASPPRTTSMWVVAGGGGGGVNVRSAESGNCWQVVMEGGVSVLRLGTRMCADSPASVTGARNFVVALDADRCDFSSQRVEINDMTRDQQDAFFEAMNTMRRVPSVMGRRSRYDDYAACHAQGSAWFHNSPMFLPWHSYYLTAFEQELGFWSDNPSLRMPYWDWTSVNTRWWVPTSGALTPSLFGTTGRPGDHCVMDGFMKGSWVPDNGAPCIMRSYDMDVGDAVEMSWSVAMYGEDFMLSVLHVDPVTGRPYVDYDAFRNAIESTAHDSFHNLIGGPYDPCHMNDASTSPNDPIFWMHHQNLERFYRYWLITNPNLAKTYDGIYASPATHQTNFATCTLNDTLVGFNVPVSTVHGVFTGAFCGTYLVPRNSISNVDAAAELGIGKTRRSGAARSRRHKHFRTHYLAAHGHESGPRKWRRPHDDIKLNHRHKPAPVSGPFMDRMRMDHKKHRRIEAEAARLIDRLWKAVDEHLESLYGVDHSKATHTQHAVAVHLAILDLVGERHDDDVPVEPRLLNQVEVKSVKEKVRRRWKRSEEEL